jgi:hypothetical protein
MSSTARLLVALAGIALWLGAIGAGYGRLLRYASTAGAAVPVPEAAAPSTGRWRLVMFVHPRCPCSRASVSELGGILARAVDRLDVEVLLVDPDGQRVEVDPQLTHLIAALPGVRVRRDPGGADARKMNASTSGQVILFDPEGHPVFSGGITAARGHAGSSAGQEIIVALIERRAVPAHRAAVFGCTLFGSAR